MQKLIEYSQTCNKHKKQLEYIDLSLADQEIYKCQDCLSKVERKDMSKLFLDQKYVEQYNKKDIFSLNQIQQQLKQIKQYLLIRKNKQEMEEVDKQNQMKRDIGLTQVIQQIHSYDPTINVRFVKSLIFEANFKNKIIQRYTFPQNLNVTTNMIQMYNRFIIFGTQEGILEILDITTNKIIISKKISSQGLVVIIKDPRRADYFFIAGYQGYIIECQLKNKKVEKECYQSYLQQQELQESQNLIHNQKIDNKKCIENKSIYSLKNQEENQKGNQRLHTNPPAVEEQKYNFNDNQQVKQDQNVLKQEECEIYLKQKRCFINKKQICRMIFCQDGKILAAGVGKKIVLWNVITGKVFHRLVGYHSSQVYGLENMFNGKYLLSISQGIINMFDITKIETPLITQYKFQRNFLCTRIKKTSENEFVIMIFPKKLAFFKIFLDKQFNSQQVNNTENPVISQQPNEMQKQISDYEDNDLNGQQELFFQQSFKKSQYQQHRQAKNKDFLIDTQINYNILKTGEITFLPDQAYNINVFDNCTFNISGDYPFSILVNQTDYQNTSTLFELEKIISSTQLPSQVSFLSYDHERVLTSILLENITIKNQFYKNVIINMPRNTQYDGEESMPSSHNLCFFA